MHLRLLASLAAGAAAVATVPITASAAPEIPSCSTGAVTVEATVPAVLQSGEQAVFGVSLTPSSGPALTGTVTVAGPATSNSTTFTGIPLGTYTLSEVPGSAWQPQPDQTVTLSAAQCSASPVFANAVVPARATFQVATTPPGSEAGWAFTLVGPGTPVGGEKLLTTGPGATTFATPLQEGFYTVAETTLTGWDQTGSANCIFTVDYPADAARTFSCKVSDTHEGRVTVAATHAGQAPTGSDAFHFVLSGGPDNVLVTQVAVASNHGSLDFGQFRPGGYTLCQQAPPTGWSTTLVAQGGIPNASGDICLPFTLAAGETHAFSIDTTGPVAASTPTPSPTPTATATPAPSGAVQGTSSGAGHVGLPATGGIAIPNTGVGLSGLAGLPLVLAGAGLVAAGRRRGRRHRR